MLKRRKKNQESRSHLGIDFASVLIDFGSPRGATASWCQTVAVDGWPLASKESYRIPYSVQKSGHTRVHTWGHTLGYTGGRTRGQGPPTLDAKIHSLDGRLI